jgi:cholesterol transport system auxiliary component
MTWPTARLSRRFVPSILILTLAGCSGLLGSGEPAHLYRLTPKSTYPAGVPHRSVQLLISEPLAPAGLDKSRIALSRSPVSIDYFADSEWTDRAPLLVQTAILQSFENSRAVTAINREAVGLRADFILDSEIRHFEAVYDSSNGPPDVWVAINIRLVNPTSREVVAQTSFERRERASANDVPSIVLAFDEALGGVMKQIVLWTVTNPALSVKPS